MAWQSLSGGIGAGSNGGGNGNGDGQQQMNQPQGTEYTLQGLCPILLPLLIVQVLII
jgi:striatin 1/3/4